MRIPPAGALSGCADPPHWGAFWGGVPRDDNDEDRFITRATGTRARAQCRRPRIGAALRLIHGALVCGCCVGGRLRPRRSPVDVHRRPGVQPRVGSRRRRHVPGPHPHRAREGIYAGSFRALRGRSADRAETHRAFAVAPRRPALLTGGTGGDSRAHRRLAQRAGPTVPPAGRPARVLRDLPDRGRLDLSGRAALRADRRRPHGDDGVARDRARDAVLGRVRARPLCRLRQLEVRVHDGRGGRGARGCDPGARRMRRASRGLAAVVALTATARGGTPGALPIPRSLRGSSRHRLSHRGSRRRQVPFGHCGSQPRVAAPRGEGQGV